MKWPAIVLDTTGTSYKCQQSRCVDREKSNVAACLASDMYLTRSHLFIFCLRYTICFSTVCNIFCFYLFSSWDNIPLQSCWSLSCDRVDVVPNLPKCPVPVLMSYRSYQKVSGTGIDVVPNLPKCPVPVLMSYRTYRSVRYRYWCCLLYTSDAADE